MSISIKSFLGEELLSLEADTLAYIDLAGANLAQADLTQRHLGNADLSGANLFRADLTGANLAQANLAGANLEEAILDEADLSYTNLAGANLSYARLWGAMLYDANFNGSSLRFANISGATWNHAHLEDAHLENIIVGTISPHETGLLRALGIERDDTLPKRILDQILDHPETWDQKEWQSACGTIHCIGGWAVALHPQGLELESRVGTENAAWLLLRVLGPSVPSFSSHADRDEIIASLEQLEKEAQQ